MIRGATNPGSIGHEWVMRRFMTESHPDRVFIPANFRDNPGIDHEDYERQLSLAGPIIRRQMMGEWIHDGTGLVYKECTSNNIIDVAPKCDYTICGLDFGIVDQNAITVLGWKQHDPVLYILESYRKTALVSEMCDEVRALEDRYHFHKIIGDTGGQGKAFTEEMRQKRGIPVEPAVKANKVGYIRVMNDDFARGMIQIVRPTCKDLLGEYKELYWDESGLREISSALNHAADSALYAHREARAYAETPDEKPKPGTLAEVARMAEAAHKKQWDGMPEEDRAIWEPHLQEEKKPWWEE